MCVSRAPSALILALTTAALLVSVAATATSAQTISQRGYIQLRSVTYPERSRSDDRHLLFEWTFRYEPAIVVAPWLRLIGGIDAGADSWHQIDRRARMDLGDRGVQRPAVSLRRLAASISRGELTINVGKQIVRWGKTDILIPTDRFAPRDYLEVTDNDFLGVTGARVQYARAGHSLDGVFLPRFTPSRLPLLGTRWAPVVMAGATTATHMSVDWASPHFPTRPQVGVRWNRISNRYEFSISFYDGLNHLPIVLPGSTAAPDRFELVRIYPRLRMYGGDAVVPFRWFTAKTEAGYFTSVDHRADEYVLYVIQVERQVGEWSLVGSYAGEKVTAARSRFDFAPDRGLARALIGRAAYALDPNRTVSFEAAVRQDGEGAWSRAEYSHAVRAHWRVTIGATVVVGADGDFFGQYRRNSHVTVGVRYSF